ncbi:NAD(P)-dependent oxidoreductase [Pseudochelatococcus sp. B33]
MAISLGFIGVGVMGAPMCRHLAQKSGSTVYAFDRNAKALEMLEEHDVQPVASAAEVMASAEIVFISLPSGAHLKSLCEGRDGLLRNSRPGQTVVDLGTSQLELTRKIGDRFEAADVSYADAPVARTRAAAEAGNLAVTVGARPEVFERIRPYLACFATEVTHCGPIGSGQVVKILNNMIVSSTVVALCEAALIAQRNGIETTELFQTLAKGSADSFALRNHGLQSVAVDSFPIGVFSTEYELKDVTYALQMARDAHVEARSARLTQNLLRKAVDAGWAHEYWPVIKRLVARPRNQESHQKTI